MLAPDIDHPNWPDRQRMGLASHSADNVSLESVQRGTIDLCYDDPPQFHKPLAQALDHGVCCAEVVADRHRIHHNIRQNPSRDI